MWWPLLLSFVGFSLLIYGGDRVCAGASALAVRLGIDQFVIGMTIVAISTSAPELITSLIATTNHHPEIVAGNIIGSNLVNIGLAGGLVALIKPFTITSRIIEKEMPFLLAVTCMFGICAIFFPIGFPIGIAFVLLNTFYLYYICKYDRDRRSNDPNHSQKVTLEIHFWKAFWIFLFGLVLLLLGAQIVIDSSIDIARFLGWSDALIGFTVIAIGTSFPEIAISLVAAFRGYGAICTGNIVGSNIFNTLMIIGSCGMINVVPIDPQLCYFGIPALVFLTALIWRFFTTKREINRPEGGVLFVAFLLIFAISIYRQL
ncbi:MAG: calcium/sodium antiporter [Puniceicoccales bacterium]|jgi:cation:H+ antiporter|nr:calcium/sodium antiporter [Puniceicoccales bacterium]